MILLVFLPATYLSDGQEEIEQKNDRPISIKVFLHWYVYRYDMREKGMRQKVQGSKGQEAGRFTA
ncbi:MAG: hypothetical protein Kow0077_22790 [Anaerolineae bacterium]